MAILENLNLEKIINGEDWEFGDVDTQFLTHNIHRYSGKFIPQIASKVIELITSKGDVILDSYMGSGTTLLEASYLERYSIGIDLNPLAVLIAKVKNSPISTEKLNSLYNHFENFCVKLDAYFEDNLFNIDEDFKSFIQNEVLMHQKMNDEWFNKWFEKSVLIKLVSISTSIEKFEDEGLRNLGLIALSEILRRCSNAHPSYPNVMYDKEWHLRKKSDPIPAFLQSLKEAIDRVKRLDTEILEKFKPSINLGDNRALSLENSSVDAIITHPPYIAAVPYAEYGSISLKWLGYEPKELDGKLTGGKRTSKYVVDKFKTGYAQFFDESYRVLKKGKYMFVMVANPTVKGNVIDLSKMSIELGNSSGFKLVASAKRNGKNRRANKMKGEHLLFFKKE
ncbi:DNA methyltransferase [Peribacillus acanthi]|uniref:DNA methyltransferase n=1 Tax=Peribacillus acanthi TaxID=2171554 RepID=UPI001300B3E0|nr:DNA methyltransferase [Peribacillus acanthi]